MLELPALFLFLSFFQHWKYITFRFQDIGCLHIPDSKVKIDLEVQPLERQTHCSAQAVHRNRTLYAVCDMRNDFMTIANEKRHKLHPRRSNSESSNMRIPGRLLKPSSRSYSNTFSVVYTSCLKSPRCWSCCVSFGVLIPIKDATGYVTVPCV